MTEFSMKLYYYLREIYPSGNMLFSPVSIGGVLSHLLLGTKREASRYFNVITLQMFSIHHVLQ